MLFLKMINLFFISHPIRQINENGGKELPRRRVSIPALTFEYVLVPNPRCKQGLKQCLRGSEDLAHKLEANEDVVEVQDEGLI